MFTSVAVAFGEVRTYPHNLKTRLGKNMIYTCDVCNSWHSLVSTATMLWAAQPRDCSFIPGKGERNILSPQCSYQLWGPQSSI